MEKISLQLLRGIDPNLLMVLSQIAKNVETLGGIRGNQSVLDRSATIGDLIDRGVLAKDSNGNIYNPNITPPEFSDQNVPTVIEGKQYANYVLDASAGLVIGTYSLTGPTLPENAIIIRARYNVSATFTSLTDAGTIQIGVQTDDADGIVAAISIDDATSPWDSGVHDGIPDPTDSSTYTTKTTAIGRAVQAVVGVENLTGGVLTLALTYIIRE